MKTNRFNLLIEELLDVNIQGSLPITTNYVSLRYVNTDLIMFISRIINKHQELEKKILILLKFKKIIAQTPRVPDEEQYRTDRAFFDSIEREQLLNDPIKFIDAELGYLQERQATILASNDSPQKDWLTAKEVCLKFVFSRSSLNRRVAEGLPYVQLGGKKMFSVSQISDWLKNQTD
ncbi:hypothetical protein J3L18_23680 [Mucilaginibacter gossypii]|uniref:helix-turn-helix transcriptional regulator n=1 Tax=Mucilaginibacter gossypii TaxID=551996 RepID=UPI000DCF28E8|nr:MULTISPECIES: hypothetical protein [Mucilaginibacter]QTE36106.1 hypothetical protein J3L18_23680 [Mucilaginibacter gossypii]RAV59980.1 hypothetical protein DIU36_03130 [Mucilaginibacter rubeus]